MSKKLAISFSEIKAETKKSVVEYTENVQELAKLQQAHSAKKQELETKLDLAKKAREAGEKESIIDELNAINRENEKYKAECKPYNEALKEIYKMIPAGMFDAYQKYVQELKRGDMLTCVDEFLTTIGVQKPTQKGCRQVCEYFTVKLGAKTASSKKVLKDGVYTSALGKGSFNKLFMAILADLFIEKGVI